MPATELPKTLVNLLGSLLTENGLLSWQIFDEKSSNIVVKIRFGNGHCGPTTDGQSAETVAAYRRKPPSQVRRDRARVAAHKCQQTAAPRMQTQSMAAVCLQTEDQACDQDSHTSDIEQTRYDDVDTSEHFLDPLAVSFEQSPVMHNSSILSRGDLTQCPDALTIPSLTCSDTPSQSVAVITSSPSSPAVARPRKPEQSDNSSVCSDTTNTSSCDDDASCPDIPMIPLCDMDSILNILRTEIRSAVSDIGISGKPD